MKHLTLILLLFPLWVSAQIQTDQDTTRRPTLATRKNLSMPPGGVLWSKGTTGDAVPLASQIFRTYAELRRFTNPVPDIQYQVSRRSQSGFFQYDPDDNRSLDDNFSTIVTTNGKRMKRVQDPGAVATGVLSGNLNTIPRSYVGAFDALEGDVPSWGALGMRYHVMDVRKQEGNGLQFVSSTATADNKLSYRIQENYLWGDFVDIGTGTGGPTIDTTRIAYKSRINTFESLNYFQKNTYFNSPAITYKSLTVNDSLNANYILRVYDKAYFTNALYLAGRLVPYLGAGFEVGAPDSKWFWIDPFTKNAMFGYQTNQGNYRLQANGNALFNGTIDASRVALTSDAYIAGTIKPHLGGNIKFGDDSKPYGYFDAATGNLIVGKTVNTGEKAQFEGTVRSTGLNVVGPGDVILNDINAKALTRDISLTGFTRDNWYDLVTDIESGTYLVDVIFSPGDNGYTSTYGVRSAGIIAWPGQSNNTDVGTTITLNTAYGNRGAATISYRLYATNAPGFKPLRLQMQVSGDGGSNTITLPVTVKLRRLL